MLRPSAIHEITDIITSDSFYASKHGLIYKTMLELSGKGEPIDLLSLSLKWKKKRFWIMLEEVVILVNLQILFRLQPT